MKFKSLKIWLFLILIFSGELAVGQIHLIDKQDNFPIPFAQLFSEGGRLVGTSNINGIVNVRSLSKFINDSSRIVIEHISYNNLSIPFDSLKNIDTLRLPERPMLLPEVTVGVKTKSPDILVLKGYFRSYQLEDSIPKYYTDGIVEYFISLSKKKPLRMKVLDHRSFRNEALVKKEKLRAYMVSMVSAGVPYIYSLTALQELDKSYSLKRLSEHEYAIRHDSATIGIVRISKPLNIIRVGVDLIAPQKAKTEKLFNYISKITKIDITANYSFQKFSRLSKENLESRKEYRRIYFKHKKEKKFTKIDVIDEFYVLKKWYLSKADLRNIKISTNFGLPESTSYSYDYWKSLNENHIPKLNINIERLLGTTLKPYK